MHSLTAVKLNFQSSIYCERITHCVPQKKQSFAEWDVNRTAQWLKALSLYDCIPQEYVILLVKSPFSQSRSLTYSIECDSTLSTA